MVAVLVTGMSGTGKSAAPAELARRGFPVADADRDGLGVERWCADHQHVEQIGADLEQDGEVADRLLASPVRRSGADERVR